MTYSNALGRAAHVAGGAGVDALRDLGLRRLGRRLAGGRGHGREGGRTGGDGLGACYGEQAGQEDGRETHVYTIISGYWVLLSTMRKGAQREIERIL